MDTVLPILLFGGLMFLMMRFGCGAHMFGRGHGHGKDAEARNKGGCCGNAAGGNSPADKLADKTTPPRLRHDGARRGNNRLKVGKVTAGRPASHARELSLD